MSVLRDKNNGDLSMRIILFACVFMALAASAETVRAQSYPPVQPDPARGSRYPSCVQIDRTRPEVCNFNPGVIGDRASPDCRTYRDNGGTVTILCPENHPRYWELQRLSAAARMCGENGFACRGAYFKREGNRCTYRVVPDGWAPGPFDVHVSDMPNERRILIYRPGEGRSHRDYESQHTRQVRYALRNESGRGSYQDPCRASAYE
ncbi:MAG: hypothetical protein QG636_731 [Patescibacteria group bacterium]|nr:hypothetical protein [Patescibacteria group bacterium]